MVGDPSDIVGEGSISDLGDLEGWWDNHSIVAWSFALFGCFLLNVILLLAFLFRPSLRTISNRFVMNLTVSNLLVCAVMNPLIVMDTSTTFTKDPIAPPSTGSICAMSEGAVATVTTSSVLSVLLIAIDQYFAVVDPLRYRARIDKLKCLILIMSTWFVSITFGLLAFFNPDPRSFWLSCAWKSRSWPSNVTVFDSLLESTTITIIQNEIGEVNSSRVPEIVETIETIRLGDDFEIIENSTVILDTLLRGTVTYGFIYAIFYSVLAYFIPFAAVCWIYVSIYVAAHRNSERARRSGSRPILSSASFSEEQNGPSRLQRFQTDTIEDFRKLPKISSLSSIDETSETMQPPGQVSRRRSFSSAMEIEVTSPPVEDQAGIVFTVGSQRVEVPSQEDSKILESTSNSDPILDERIQTESCTVNSPSERLEDSSKLLEESSNRSEDHGRTSDCWNSRNFANESSDSENEAPFENFDGRNDSQARKRFSSPVAVYPLTLLESNLKIDEAPVEDSDSSDLNDDSKPNQLKSRGNEMDNNDQSEGCLLQANEESRNSRQRSQGDSKIPLNPSEVKLSRRLLRDVTADERENGKLSNSCDKTEKDSSNTAESAACLLTPIVTITPAPSKNDNLHRVSSVRSTSSYINSLKDRISNGSIFRHREETRAARISALVIVMGLICWSPYVILLVMKNLPRSTDQYLSHKYDVLASSLLILAAYISPLLFGYRSKRVKRELRRFFCFRRELSYKNNRSLMAKKVLKRRHSSTLSHCDADPKYNIFNCVYGRNRWPKEKVQFVQVPDTALAVETCRSSFSSGASTQISTTSTEEC